METNGVDLSALYCMQMIVEDKNTFSEKAIELGKLADKCIELEQYPQAENILNQVLQLYAPQLHELITRITSSIDSCLNSHKEREQLLNEIKKWDLDDKNLEPHAQLLMQSGILYFNKSQLGRSLCYFKVCERLSLSISLSSDIMNRIPLFLAQVYQRVNLFVDSSKYCIQTLTYQFQNLMDSKVFDFSACEEWINNGLKLQPLFQSDRLISDACNVLNACDTVLSKMRLSLGNEDIWNRLNAEICDQYSRIILSELQDSSEMSEHVRGHIVTLELREAVQRRSSLASHRKFFLSLPICIHDFATAVAVYNAGAQAIACAQKYFQLDGFVTRYVALVERKSHLLRALLQYEPDSKRQFGLQLRRMKLLTQLLQTDWNVQAFFHLLQPLYYEIGSLYCDLYERKRALKASMTFDPTGDTGEGPKATSSKELHYFSQAKHYLETFIISFYTGNLDDAILNILKLHEAKLPQNMDSSSLRSLLLGYFSLARLMTTVRIVESVANTKELWKSGIKCFETILTLANAFERTETEGAVRFRDVFSSELDISREMIQLMPGKLDRLIQCGTML